MAKNKTTVRQYRFNNRGDVLIVQAFNKRQVQLAYETSNRCIQKYCSCLLFDEDRKLDVDLTNEKGKK